MRVVGSEGIKKEEKVDMSKQTKTFNMIITGVGGQGLITLLQVISKAALDKGLAVRTSELHGLSQRGGSVSVHIRFGKQVHSPIVPKGTASLVIALEIQEALNAVPFASAKTAFLVNKYQSPTMGQSVSSSYVKNTLTTVSKKTFFMPADEITKKELGTSVVAGTFFLGFAAAKGLISLTENDIKKAIQTVMPEKYWDINMKAIDLAIKYGKKK